MAKVKRQPYTRDEQRTIVEYVQKFPHNMAEAFKHASRHLKGRSAAAISNQYYSTIRPMLDDQGIIVTQLSTVHGTINNRKTVTKQRSQRVEVISSLIERLNPTEQRELLEELFDKM